MTIVYFKCNGIFCIFFKQFFALFVLDFGILHFELKGLGALAVTSRLWEINLCHRTGYSSQVILILSYLTIVAHWVWASIAKLAAQTLLAAWPSFETQPCYKVLDVLLAENS